MKLFFMYRLLLRFKTFPIWNWLFAMWNSRITIPFLWIEFVNPCAKGECFWIKTKGFFWFVCFFYSIKSLKSYHILCFFLTWAMTLFLYNCFILPEISNYLSFSWILCFIISAFSILSLLLSGALSPSCSIQPVGGSLESCTAIILEFLSTALLGLVSLFPGFRVFFLAFCSLYK